MKFIYGRYCRKMEIKGHKLDELQKTIQLQNEHIQQVSGIRLLSRVLSRLLTHEGVS